MYRVLRPELRGAQRVLRSVQKSRCASPRIVIRSFSSYTRLLEQSKPDDAQGKPTPETKASTDSSENSLGKIHELSDFFQRFASGKTNQPQHNGPRQGSEGAKDKSHGVDIEASEDLKDAPWWNAVSSFLKTGKAPDGYRAVLSYEDVPAHLQGKPFPPPPYLYSEDPNSDGHHTPTQLPLSALHDNLALEHEAQQRLENTDEAEPTTYRGRRRKHLANKVASSVPHIPQERFLPEWFYKSNVNLAETQQLARFPVNHSGQSTHVASKHVTAQSDQGLVQVAPPESAKDDLPEPKKTSYARGREGPPSIPAAESDPSPAPQVPTSYITNSMSLADGRYFIEAAQYEELISTFKGRLPSPASSDGRSALAVNHLTILHGAQDSELLLDALVLDLCSSVGADRVRLDIQDISDLTSKTVTDDRTGEDATQLTFNLYQKLYGPNLYQDSYFPRREEEDQDDEDEDPHTIGSIGIGAIEVPFGDLFPSSGGKNPFQGVFSQLKSQRDLMNSPGRLSNRHAQEVFKRASRYGPVISSILSSSGHAQTLSDSQIDNESAEIGIENKPNRARPLVIHLQNSRLMQDHPFTQGFVSDLLETVENRRAQGQSIIVIGTDALRDYQKTSAPRSILEEQERKLLGASTTIVLTPVFPDRNAELALSVEDRKTRIQTVNVRHLHQVLKTRGVLFHGLEDGFWDTDYKEKIGETDYDTLSGHFWPYTYIQRLAAIIPAIESQTPLEDAARLIAASDESKVAWAQRNQPDLARQEMKEAERPKNRKLSQIRAQASKHERKLLGGVIEPGKISTTFEDIHIPVETTDALKLLTTLSLQRPEAFRYGVLKSDRIPGLLLYGPPGTGKTLAAKAVARESGATMLEVSGADLNDMYVGEGEKNVQALFSLARKLSPCVVFLDEADAMFSARSNRGRASHRELLNQFLREWDGMSNDSGSAFIMVATNRPHDLDDAVLRRLPRRLLVDLPTEADRLKILHIHLRQEALDSTVDLAKIASSTPFYSGSDLKNVAVAAALNAVRDEAEVAAKHRLEHPDEDYTYPEKRTLTGKHFEKALEEISASISEDMASLRDIKKFDEQYGDKRGRKRKAPRWGFKSAGEADKVLDTVKVRDVK